MEHCTQDVNSPTFIIFCGCPLPSKLSKTDFGVGTNVLTIVVECLLTMCDSRKYPYSPHGRSLEIPRGRGVLKAKLFEEKYEAKLEFPVGRAAKQKTCSGRREYRYFLELHLYTL